ncbi:Cell cycle checkpoint control protein rad9b [Linnemannia gamsii]|uniref:Cell cycle checkpoint control protein rad9b n=1 Tax=Linnemannia gamsii TaxID=64522 RepID=A0ABQ7K3G3_9FUNG|nr:Cell cycle checkpoint control protein rad9b [Linnemannia gamsii]
MKAIIPIVSIKGFQNVLTCLDKVGDDITIEARQDRLILSTLSLTRTAYANFTFSRTFFENYSLDLSSPAIQYDDDGPYLRCTIIAKALVSACRVRGNIEEKIYTLSVYLNAAEGVGEDCRLTVEVLFKSGCIKFHKLLYQSCLENLQLIDSVDTFQNSWELSAPAMNGLADYFSSKAEEMTMKFNDSGIVLQTYNDTGEDSDKSKRFGATMVPIERAAMNQYRTLNDGQIVFSLKEFKAILAFTVGLRLPMSAYFDISDRPIVFIAESENVVSAKFALATIDVPGEKSTQASQASRSAAADGLDLTQAENALFLDDDADWASQLEDMETEAAQTSTSVSVVSASASTSGGSGGSGNAYVIEEEFVPSTVRNPKRPKYDLEDDDW